MPEAGEQASRQQRHYSMDSGIADVRLHRLERYMASEYPDFRGQGRRRDRIIFGSAAARGRVLRG